MVFYYSNADPPGFNLPNVLTVLRNITADRANWERDTVSTGGRSLIALIIPNMGTVNDEQRDFALQHQQILREDAPDLRFIFWSGSSTNNFERFVRDPSRDLYQLRIDLQGIGGDSIQAVAFPVIHRIQQEPRRIINHRCVKGLPFVSACCLIFNSVKVVHSRLYKVKHNNNSYTCVNNGFFVLG